MSDKLSANDLYARVNGTAKDQGSTLEAAWQAALVANPNKWGPSAHLSGNTKEYREYVDALMKKTMDAFLGASINNPAPPPPLPTLIQCPSCGKNVTGCLSDAGKYGGYLPPPLPDNVQLQPCGCSVFGEYQAYLAAEIQNVGVHPRPDNSQWLFEMIRLNRLDAKHQFLTMSNGHLPHTLVMIILYDFAVRRGVGDLYIYHALTPGELTWAAARNLFVPPQSASPRQTQGGSGVTLLIPHACGLSRASRRRRTIRSIDTE